MTDIERTTTLAAMAECGYRLKFTAVEVIYCLGKLRQKLPLDRVAAKFGVSPETITAYESILVEQAQIQNPLLHVLTDRENAINIGMDAAIAIERDRRTALVAKLEEDWLDPAMHPRMAKEKA